MMMIELMIMWSCICSVVTTCLVWREWKRRRLYRQISENDIYSFGVRKQCSSYLCIGKCGDSAKVDIDGVGCDGMAHMMMLATIAIIYKCEKKGLTKEEVCQRIKKEVDTACKLYEEEMVK